MQNHKKLMVFEQSSNFYWPCKQHQNSSYLISSAPATWRVACEAWEQPTLTLQRKCIVCSYVSKLPTCPCDISCSAVFHFTHHNTRWTSQVFSLWVNKYLHHLHSVMYLTHIYKRPFLIPPWRIIRPTSNPWFDCHVRGEMSALIGGKYFAYSTYMLCIPGVLCWRNEWPCFCLGDQVLSSHTDGFNNVSTAKCYVSCRPHQFIQH